MTKELSKLEILEEIVKSENIMSTEKVCILSSLLPDKIKRDMLLVMNGMVHMAELMNTHDAKEVG